MRLQKKAAAVSGKPKKQVPASPIPDDADDNSVPPTPSTAEKTKKERKPPKVFQKLDSGSSGAVPVDVTYEEDPEANDSTIAKVIGVVLAHILQPAHMPDCRNTQRMVMFTFSS